MTSKPPEVAMPVTCKTGTVVDVALLAGAWRYRASAKTGWPVVNTMIWCDTNFSFSVAARTTVWADLSLTFTLLAAGKVSGHKTTTGLV